LARVRNDAFRHHHVAVQFEEPGAPAAAAFPRQDAQSVVRKGAFDSHLVADVVVGRDSRADREARQEGVRQRVALDREPVDHVGQKVVVPEFLSRDFGGILRVDARELLGIQAGTHCQLLEELIPGRQAGGNTDAGAQEQRQLTVDRMLGQPIAVAAVLGR
jgi:hypothetical protein